MSSHGPEHDDDDTGPVHVDPVPRDPAAGERRFEAPLSVNPRPVHKDRRPVALLATATVAVGCLGVLAWLFWPAPDEDTPVAQTTAPVSETQSADQVGARLMGMLPRGYPPDACEVVEPPEGALAQVSCRRNGDPGGPLSATYTLARDDGSLESIFDDVLDALSVVNCPGNIQSPGPWRRNATPEQTAGTLVCGFQQSTSTVAWTTEAQRLVSEVQSGPQGPNMVQLYTWWSSHS